MSGLDQGFDGRVVGGTSFDEEADFLRGLDFPLPVVAAFNGVGLDAGGEAGG